MTIDDDNSVYVGGLPYDATEDTLRKAFDLYGRVVVVKIVNDRGVGGKCYGFVTFTNPRAATNAINDMNGRKIDGRVVKVSEVKTRGGGSNFGRENFKRNPERGTDWDRGRDRDITDDRDRNRDRHRERSLDRSQDREKRGYNRMWDLDRTRDQLSHRDRGRDQHGDNTDMEQEHDGNDDRPRDRDSNSDRYQDKEVEQSKNHQRSEEKDRGQISRLLNGSDANDHRSRERSSEFIGGDDNQVEEQLGFSAQRLEELKNEVSQMEGLIEEKKESVAKLQEKSKSLEHALSRAKSLTSQRQMQLTKLQKSYLHTKEYSDKLKSSEEELQSLVDSTMIEIECGDNVGSRNGVLANGNASHLQCV